LPGPKPLRSDPSLNGGENVGSGEICGLASLPLLPAGSIVFALM